MSLKFALVLGILISSTAASNAQLPPTETEWVQSLKLTGGFPPKILSSKAFVFHAHTLSQKQLALMQDYFHRAGIDAVGYFPLDLVLAGKDVTRAVWAYLNQREIGNLIIVDQVDNKFRVSVTAYNSKETIIEPQQPAWSVAHSSLLEALKILNRSVSVEFKKENLLVNTAPETDIMVNPILGKRNEFFAVDMKVDLVAVPKFGNEVMDNELARIMEANFPLQYKLVEPNIPEKELRKQGLLYILCFVHTRGELAKELLGYKSTKPETALVSVTYAEGKQQLKTIPSSAPVYKAYFKHIDSGNIFLGTKWDADETWQQALLNNIRAMKAELRLN